MPQRRRFLLRLARAVALGGLAVFMIGSTAAAVAAETPTTVPRSGLAVKGAGVALIVVAVLVAPALSILGGRFIRRRKGRLNWWQRTALILFPLVVLAGGLAYLITMVRIPDLDALRAAIPRYQAVDTAPVGNAYLKGRVVVIQQYGEDLHSIFNDLPEDLKAYVPEEVSTVVTVACSEDVKGYVHSLAGTTEVCNSSSCSLRVIDWTIPAVLVAQDFSTQGQCAGILDGPMLEYLLNLPREVG